MKVSPDGIKLAKRKRRPVNMTVTVCNQLAVIKNIWNKRIVFYMPKCNGVGPYTVNVSDGIYHNASQTFTYTGIVVPSIPTVYSF